MTYHNDDDDTFTLGLLGADLEPDDDVTRFPAAPESFAQAPSDGLFGLSTTRS